jgi:hypothetical protein
MDKQQMIEELKREKARIESAIQALEGNELVPQTPAPARSRGYRRAKPVVKRRKMSPEARKKISDAQTARWDKRRAEKEQEKANQAS